MRQRLLTITHKWLPSANALKNTRISSFMHARGRVLLLRPQNAATVASLRGGATEESVLCKGAIRGRVHLVNIAPEGVPLAARVLARAVGHGVGHALRAGIRPCRQALAACIAIPCKVQSVDYVLSRVGSRCAPLCSTIPRAVIKKMAYHSPCQGQLPPHRGSKMFSPAAPCRSSQARPLLRRSPRMWTRSKVCSLVCKRACPQKLLQQPHNVLQGISSHAEPPVSFKPKSERRDPHDLSGIQSRRQDGRTINR